MATLDAAKSLLPEKKDILQPTPGEVLFWSGKNGEKLVVLAVPDLDGRVIRIPQHRDDIVVGGEVPVDLKMRGISEFTQGVIDPEKERYLANAMMRMSELAAVHATYNMGERPDLNKFPVGVPTQTIGLMGPPWSGKTFLLLTTHLLEPDDHLGVLDWDKFGIESISNCLESVVDLVGGDIDSLRGSIRNTVDAVLSVYKDKRSKGETLDTSKVTLREELNKLVANYEGGNWRDVQLIDLPGYGSRSAPPHVFQLLRYAMETIDLGKAIKEDRGLAWTVEEGKRVPMEEKFPHADSAAAYFIQLRRMVFNPEMAKKTSLLGKALSNSYERQFAIVQMLHEKVTG